MLHELHRALRALRRSPGFALAAALTLALGIGLASATAVVARAIAFAGLPVRDAERVVVLWGSDRSGTMPHLPLAPRDLPALAAAMRGVATVGAGDYYGANPWTFRPRGAGADGDATPLRLRGTLAGGSYFAVLGVRPVVGRAIGPEDDVPGAPRVMVLSHAAWRTHFGADPRVIGRSVHAVQHGAPYTIVGVMPPGLDLPRGVEFWTAMAPTAAVNGSMEQSWAAADVIARLAPGATAEQARAVLTTFYATVARERAGAGWYAGARATVRTLPEFVTGDVRPAFTALAASAAVVLLVTCGNVAGLLLVRGVQRRRELAVRAAIGAGRGRLFGQLLAEHAALALAGGAVGAVITVGAVHAFRALAPAELPRLADLGVDWRVLAASAVITGGVVVLVGVVPAVLASAVAPATALGGARDGAGGRVGDRRVRQGLVGAQVALALVVLVAAGLVGRSLARLSALDLGIPAVDRLALVELVLSNDGAAAESREAAAARWQGQFDAIMTRVRATPGVAAVAPAVAAPFAGTAGWDFPIESEGAGPEGGAPGDTTRRPTLNAESTGPDYLRATGVPLLGGRFFTDADRADAPPVVVLSAGAARALFPGVRAAEAVGRRVRLGQRGAWRTVVGVVGDTRYREFLASRATVYFSFRQFEQPPNYLAVRMVSDPGLAAVAVRRAAAEVAPTMLVRAAGSVRTLAAAPLARPRLLSAVLGAYALVVVVLAVAGLYAVVAGSVAQRRREFGVRSAVGATPRALASLVLGEGLLVAALGAAAGLCVALAGTRLLAAVLHGVSPTDPLTLAGAVAALLAVCAAAALVPARRAARVSPAAVLRGE